MTTERHPAGYRWRTRFPDATAVVIVEGGASFAARDDDGYWLITDNGTMADFIHDEEVLAAMVVIERFDDAASWRRAIRELQAKLPHAARLARRFNDDA